MPVNEKELMWGSGGRASRGIGDLGAKSPALGDFYDLKKNYLL